MSVDSVFDVAGERSLDHTLTKVGTSKQAFYRLSEYQVTKKKLSEVMR